MRSAWVKEQTRKQKRRIKEEKQVYFISRFGHSSILCTVLLRDLNLRAKDIFWNIKVGRLCNETE